MSTCTAIALTFFFATAIQKSSDTDKTAMKPWAERVGKTVSREGWVVEAKGNEVIVRRTKPVALVENWANSIDGKPTPAGEGTIQFALSFGPKMSADEYDRLAGINAALDKEFDRLNRELKLPHKFDDIIATTPEEKERLKTFREVTAKLPRHDLPDLYSTEHSIQFFHSNGWRYPAEKTTSTECTEVVETLLRLFGLYNPAVANRSQAFGRYRK